MGIKFTQRGDYSVILDYLNKRKHLHYIEILNEYGQKGVEALASVTPKDTGRTAESWEYDVEFGSSSSKLTFRNTAIEDGWFSIVIGLDQGHGTRNGGYVAGKNFITPAIEPIIMELVAQVHKEVAGK